MASNMCGTYYHSIDAKGRMSFPNKLREDLGPEFYLCIGHDDHYIAVYSPEEFDVYQSKLSTIPGKAGSDLRRKLLSFSEKQVPDKQGRISVSQPLRNYAMLNKDVVVIGSSNHAEIWDKDAWDEFNSKITLADISAQLENLVL